MIKFAAQPDMQLKLKLYQEKLLKKFTKDSFNSKVIKIKKEVNDSASIQLHEGFKSLKMSNNTEIEGLMMERMKNFSPRKKIKVSQNLNKQIRSRLAFQQNKNSFYKNQTEIISANEFVNKLSKMSSKAINESLDYKQEYVKKIEKLNDIFKGNVNNYLSYKSQNKTFQTPDKSKQLFNNEILSKVLSRSNNEKYLKKQPDSIPLPHKQIDLEINQSNNRTQTSSHEVNDLKLNHRAQSAHNVEDTKVLSQQNYNDFRNRFYRMQDLDKLLAKSLSIAERADYKEYEKNKLLKGALRNSSNLNYHIDAVLRAIARGKNYNTPTNNLNSVVGVSENRLINNFRELKLDTKKKIQQNLNNIDKMLYINSGTLKFISPQLKRPASAGPKFSKRLELRSKIMKQSRILEISLEHSALSKKSRMYDPNTPMRNMSYVNYFL